ncbi:hypothetical protein B7C51_21485 [Paenibacillus larvae subsp. pulvifaciens]|uniref:HTH cro/C1-type domain-containing protein n=2 Tax=Paenibacillus larvae TaxID=1464 RepID=A0A1V0UZN4_9BACL|nr:hypothetical protein B7C51_21485 [Paenibacillus larvae subsp. pulvifaciens]
MNRKTKKKVKPSPDSLKKLAEAYGIEYYELLQKAGIIDEGTESALDEANSKLDKLIEETVNNSTHISTIPLIRTICAGDGIIATENIEDYVAYPLLKGNKPDYALRVQGDSMKDVGIDDGDIVFLKAANWVEKNGQIVAVIFNGEEGTLKRVYWDEIDPKVRLVPENKNYKQIEAYPNEIHICGVYAGHFKSEFQML